MKNRLFVLTIAIVISLNVYSQDTIVEKNGKVILCKIQRDDSTSIYFNATIGNRNINTSIMKDNIRSVKYGKIQSNQSDISSQTQNSFSSDMSSFGIGFGLDYGGIGGNLLYYPQRNVGLFLGVGYAFAGFGYNLGMKLRLIGEKHSSPATAYLIGMYGYNAAIAVSNADQFNKLFYGPSIGFGLDYKSNPSKLSYWTFSLLFPIRGSEVDDYITDLKNNHGVEFKNDLLPIAISVGYRFILN